MDPTRWADIETVFHAARERPVADRRAFVSAASKGDAGVEREVLSLLAADEAAGGFIESPAWQPPSPLRRLDEKIGPYRLCRLHATGGMGEVYVAERDDDQYQQQVALKVIRTGMASDLLVRRFRQERQILAGLSHPGIARLLDGGATADGLPYLVMEFVDGEPIDVFADRMHLDTRARLALVAQTCAALDEAHRHLVVHRDIKPGNILVTASGQPVIVDFGIAKLVAGEGGTDDPEPTATAARSMTLEYASPEQIRNQPVTPASDVYSLGVVLYRLVAGRSPYTADTAALNDLTRAICDTEPPRPSAAAHRRDVTADVDVIVLKALRKEPEQRYRSAEHLAEDITRYLEGRPVLARQGSWSYRAGRFVRRHRVAVAAAAVVIAAGGVAVSSIVTERARAVRRFNDVRDLARAVVFDYHDAIEALPGSTPVRERLVRDALTYLDSLNREAEGDLSLEQELAAAYQKIGDVQGNAYYANLGQTSAGLESHRKALALRESIAREAPTDPEPAFDLARAYDRVGDLLWESNDLTGARDHFARSIEVLTRTGAAEFPAIEPRIALAAGHEKLADVLGNPGFANLGDTAGAVTHYRQSLIIRESAAAIDAANPAVQSALFGSYQRLGAALRVTGDPAGALAHVRKAQAIQESITAARPTPATQRTLAIAYSRTSDELELQNQLDEARMLTDKSLAVFEQLYTTDTTNHRAHRELAVMLRKVARLALKAGDHALAERTYRRANAIATTLSERDLTNAEARRDLSVGLRGLADVLAAREQHAPAMVEYRRALAISVALVASAPGNAQARGDAALTHAAIAALQAHMGDLTAAAAAYRHAIAERETLAKADTANIPAQIEAARVSFDFAELLARAGSGTAEERRAAYRRSATIWSALDAQGKLPDPDRARLERATAAAGVTPARFPSFP